MISHQSTTRGRSYRVIGFTCFLVPTDSRLFLVGTHLACGSFASPSLLLISSPLPPTSLSLRSMDVSRPNSHSHFFPFGASSLPSAHMSNRASQTTERVDEDDQFLSTTPTLSRTSPRKSTPVPRAPTRITKSSSSPISDFSPTSRTPRHSFSQRMPVLPSYQPSSPIPLRRSRSRSSTNSSSSSGSEPHSSQQHGMGRKVAASLDIFRETATSADELDNVDEPSIPLVASTSRRVSTKRPKSSAEPEFSFFKRSEWPDRENVAARREQSDVTRDRARTRGVRHSASVSRGASDGQRRKDRPSSVRENVIGDLVNWRTNVLGDSFKDRGRPHERSLVSNQPIDTVDHQSFHRNESSSFRHPRGFQYSPSSSSPLSPTDIVLTSPIVPPAIIADSPLPRKDPLPPPSVSPYTTEDEDDESSNWDDETASDSGTTVSTNSPWPRSPFHSSDSLPPVAKPSVHHDDRDEDDEDAGLVTRSRVQQPLVPQELSGLPSYLSSFQGVDVQPEEHGPYHGILSQELANLSQESLPHIPLRPFRNQVGGHSAIYKFTKRAVCKVCWIIYLSDYKASD